MNFGSFTWRLIGIGWFVAISIVAFTLGGLWLDNKLNTRPWLSLTGATLGTFVALYGVYRMVSSGLKEEGNPKSK